MAALLTRTSMRPKRSMAASASARVLASSATSTRAPSATRPSAAHSAATARACSSRMSATTTCAPSRAKRSAYALPMPCAAPVTIATRSRRRTELGRFLALRFALELVLQHLDRDRVLPLQDRGHVHDRPVDGDLAGVIRVPRPRREAVLIGGIDGRIEGLRGLVRRAVELHHRNPPHLMTRTCYRLLGEDDKGGGPKKAAVPTLPARRTL